VSGMPCVALSLSAAAIACQSSMTSERASRPLQLHPPQFFA
jgi:hypothetical protein